MPLFGPPNIEKLKRKRDIQGLVRALHHKDADVRSRAADALSGMGDARAVEPLFAALEDREAEVRASAAVALGKLKDSSAVDALAVLLYQDSIHLVQLSAAEALGNLGDARAVPSLVMCLQARQRGYDLRCDLHATAGLRAAAASSLGQLGDRRALDPLSTALRKDDDMQVRTAAALSLGALGDARAIDPLVSALKRQSFERITQQQRDPMGRADIIVTLGRREVGEPVRVAAARALKELGDLPAAERAVDPLIAALSDKCEDLHQAAAEALETIGGETAQRALAAYRARQK
jgi:HEAT repeat protein